MNKSSLNFRLIFVAIIFIGVFLLRTFYPGLKKHGHDSSQTNQQTTAAFNRNNDHLILTTHAKCRMDCRHITEEEIKEILHEGNIDYNKSNTNDERGASYALEGYTHEQQHLRVVFSPKTDGMVVVTCIDLDKEWQCNCN